MFECLKRKNVVSTPCRRTEKRGWTLNSAGYLLGPHGIDGHRTLGDKSGLAGKRDAAQEEDVRTGALRIADGDVIHTLLDFLSYLKLKGKNPHASICFSSFELLDHVDCLFLSFFSSVDILFISDVSL
uniref:Galanin peptides n=1 Tax=Takifugu rubripes TaxID=31033 RepID=A0A674NME9_TAKRU